jgi:protein-S-isoprenylcysteine O-methyltransferase Ste14
MSIIPGFSNLIDKVPELGTPRGFARAAATVIVPAAVLLVVFVYVETLAPIAALALQIVTYVLAYWLIGQAVNGRRLRLSYADAFYTRFLPSAGLNLGSGLYIIAGGGWATGEEYLHVVPKWLGVLFAIYLVITGVLLILRAMQLAGVDTIALVYNYYPDEGRRLSSSLYRLIRHPVYAGIDRLALALAMWNGSAYSLLLASIFIFAYHPRWYGLEEVELVERFGDEYRSYKEKVPAVFPSSARGEIALLEAITRRLPELRGDGDSGAPIG